MNCPEVRQLLSRQLDGALEDEREVAIAGHLSECARCSSYRSEIHRVSVLLDAVAAPLREGAAEIVASLSGRRPGTETVPIRRSRRALWSVLGAAGALAVVFAAAVHFGVIPLSGGVPDVPPLPSKRPNASRDPIDAVQCLLKALGQPRAFEELHVLSGAAFASPGRLANPDACDPPPDVVVEAARVAGVAGAWVEGTPDRVRPVVDDDRPALIAFDAGDGRRFRLVVATRDDGREWLVHDAREGDGFAWHGFAEGWSATPTGRLRPVRSPAFLPDPPGPEPAAEASVARAFAWARGAAASRRSAYRVGWAALIEAAGRGEAAEALKEVAYDREVAALFLRRAADDPARWGTDDPDRWHALADRFDAVAARAKEVATIPAGPVAADEARALRDQDVAAIADLR